MTGDVRPRTGPMVLWLLGADVSGSPSPVMQAEAMRCCGVEGSYTARSLDDAELAGALAAIRRGDADGANITIPHKRAAAAACDVLEGDAERLRAVNTVRHERGRLVGATTDTEGLLAAIEHAGLRPEPGGIGVVLGGGGAAGAAALTLRRLGCARVVVAPRQAASGTWIATALSPSPDVEVIALDDTQLATALRDAALVVNATPVGMGDLPLDPPTMRPDAVLLDLRYRPRPLDTVAAARSAGLRADDGLEMLLRQGLASMKLWTGCDAPADAVRRALYRAVGAEVAA